MIGAAVVGLGYWGPNLVRNIAGRSGIELRAICDQSQERLDRIQRQHASVLATRDFTDLLKNPSIDVIIIATPVSTHFPLALQALQAGKHVMVEKPLAHSVACAEQLVEEAEKRNLVLMNDHTFVYTSAVRKIKELVDSGDLGALQYYDSVRINLGLVQPDINVMWDLAVHDLTILDYLFGRMPEQIHAVGRSHVAGKPESMAYLTALYADDFVAHCHVNWVAPVKVRRTMIGGDRQMIVYDDMLTDEKIKVYDKGVSLEKSGLELRVNYRSGDMRSPNVDNKEALGTVIDTLVQAIDNRVPSPTDGRSGLRVVRILEAADRSMRENGRPVALDSL